MRDTVSLPEAAARLGVHYMTAYRYVRTGVLPATQVGSQWRVPVAEVEALGRRRTGTEDRRAWTLAASGPASGRTERASRLERRLVAGDEGGVWRLLNEALVSGAGLVEVLLGMLAPAMVTVGERWEAGSISVADEHRATAVAMRIVGRLGPLAAHRGVGRGVVVVGAPPGERHQLPVAIAADVLRARGFDVVDLGCDVPAATWARPACRPRVVAVAVGVTGSGQDRSVRAVMAAVSRSAPGVARLVGGAGMEGPDHAASLGALWSGLDADQLSRAVLDVSA